MNKQIKFIANKVKYLEKRFIILVDFLVITM